MGIDARIRSEHIARYGATEAVETYLSVLERVPTVPNTAQGENHHMLARSIWPEYGDLRTHPWNRLRVCRGVHTALTELQSRFEDRLMFAVFLMKGQSVDAQFDACQRGGLKNIESGHLDRIRTLEVCSMGGKANTLEHLRRISSIGGKRVNELHPNQMSEIGKVGGSKGGKRTAELYPNLASERGRKGGRLGGLIGGKIGGRMHVESGHIFTIATPESCKKGGKIAACLRHNIRRGKPCICGHHS